MHSGIAISLKYQHNHIEDSVLVYSCDKCTIYLVANEEMHPSSFVKLEFKQVQCVRSARTDCSPAIGIYSEKPGASYIVELTQSTWPVDAHKSYVYAGSLIQPGGHHFVVTNHDIFHEILAESFVETLLEPNNKEYHLAKSLFS